ncbi:hypothetical protein AMAG_00068 [Allomyces macrogynus ATCC 38327]|uniref:Acid phosphatase n=1 Tax=Allomyces macrogynus (strain ATCC 38327) TaxID=578462 RepID=A0A0L0RVG2_ALLM3|nr:hypothetical protein AMAG_00068 [Allomyces macrogynus ATCC 38327]|eukprot:KNE54065.1 hypothetical protein AMAG_00068 [Allomyces macrogynus ATCC 38327]
MPPTINRGHVVRAVVFAAVAWALSTHVLVITPAGQGLGTVVQRWRPGALEIVLSNKVEKADPAPASTTTTAALSATAPSTATTTIKAAIPTTTTAPAAPARAKPVTKPKPVELEDLVSKGRVSRVPWAYCEANMEFPDPLVLPEFVTLQDQYELHSVKVFVRHGDRTPTTWPAAMRLTATNRTVLDTLPIWSGCDPVAQPSRFKLKTYPDPHWAGDCVLGQLTTVGAQQLRRLGQVLRRRYPALVAKNATTFRSTDFNRTIASAWHLAQGLLHDAAFDPARIESLHPKEDVLSLASNPNLTRSIFDDFTLDGVPATGLARLGVVPDGNVTVWAASKVFDVLAASTCHGLDVEFAVRDSAAGEAGASDAGSTSLVATASTEAASSTTTTRLDRRAAISTDGAALIVTNAPVASSSNVTAATSTTPAVPSASITSTTATPTFEPWSVTSGPGLNLTRWANRQFSHVHVDFIAATGTRLLHKLVVPASPHPGLAIYATHDTTLGVLLRALDVELTAWPPYASHVVIEEWRDAATGWREFRVLYNGKDVCALAAAAGGGEREGRGACAVLRRMVAVADTGRGSM